MEYKFLKRGQTKVPLCVQVKMDKENRILVVEDNNFVRMQIISFLNDAGFQTEEATDGESAMEAMTSNIDLAIVDVRMEPVGGFEFIRHLRGANVQTPVILVTGDESPDLLNEASKWSVGAVLRKPVQKDRLIKTVSRTLHVENRTS